MVGIPGMQGIYYLSKEVNTLNKYTPIHIYYIARHQNHTKNYKNGIAARHSHSKKEIEYYRDQPRPRRMGVKQHWSLFAEFEFYQITL